MTEIEKRKLQNSKKKKEKAPENHEENISSIDKARKKRRRAASFERLLIIAAVAACVIAVIIGIRAIGTDNISVFLSDTFTGFARGDGFPVEMDGDSAVTVKALGKCAAVVTDKSIFVYNTGGGEVRSLLHSFANPVAVAKSDRLLTFDSGGYKLRIDSRTSTLFEKNDYENRIVTAALSKSGRFAVSTEIQRYLCHVTVCDGDGAEVFKWHSSDSYITALSLSDDGKRVAAGAFSIDGSETVPKVKMLSTSEGELFSVNLKGGMVISVEILSGGRISALTDEELAVVSQDGKAKTEKTFGGKVVRWARGGELTAVAVEKDEGGVCITVFGADTSEKFIADGIYGLLDMTFYKDKLYISCAEGIIEADADGERVLELFSDGERITGDSLRIASLKNGIYCVLENGLWLGKEK